MDSAEGVHRANLYLQAGADYATLLPRTAEETKQIPKEVPGPLNYVNGEPGLAKRPDFTARELGTMGGKCSATRLRRFSFITRL